MTSTLFDEQEPDDMNRTPGSMGSGDGTRPTTSGGVDNIGAGEKFAGNSSAAGDEDTAPAPPERMQQKRRNAEAARHDGSAAYGLRENFRSETNREPPSPEQERT
jgi:hypothetical protein